MIMCVRSIERNGKVFWAGKRYQFGGNYEKELLLREPNSFIPAIDEKYLYDSTHRHKDGLCTRISSKVYSLPENYVLGCCGKEELWILRADSSELLLLNDGYWIEGSQIVLKNAILLPAVKVWLKWQECTTDYEKHKLGG